MERGLRRKAGLYEDWCDTPVPHNTNYEMRDIGLNIIIIFIRDIIKQKAALENIMEILK